MALERREQILSQAARLFRERGYHGVGIDDIGEAVGITGPAIYRHYRNKQQLLAEIVERSMSLFTEQLRAATDSGVPSVERFAELQAGSCLTERDLVAVYTLDARHLPEPLQSDVRRLKRSVVKTWERALKEVRPDLPHAEARLRIAGATGIALVPLAYRSPLPADHVRDRLAGMMVTALTAEGDGPPTRSRTVTPRSTTGRRARRDRLLEEATRLFWQQGFPAVTVEAIAAATGIDQSSVYRHYTGKAEILATALERAAVRLDEGVAEMRDARLPPSLALDHLIASYVDSGFEHGVLTSVWCTESVYLVGEDGSRSRRRQRQYIDVWVELMCEIWPHLDHPTAELIARGVFGFINSCVSLPKSVALSGGRFRVLVRETSRQIAQEAALRSVGAVSRITSSAEQSAT